MATVCFQTKSLTIINPLGNTAYKKQLHYTKLMHLLHEKNIRLTFASIVPYETKWQLQLCCCDMVHILESMIQNDDLSIPTDFDKYRLHMKKILITKSENMTHKCLYCGTIILEEFPFKCSKCQRIMHKACILGPKQLKRKKLTLSLSLIKQNCYLCQNYHCT